jgi:hypothetical protein
MKEPVVEEEKRKTRDEMEKEKKNLIHPICESHAQCPMPNACDTHTLSL